MFALIKLTGADIKVFFYFNAYILLNEENNLKSQKYAIKSTKLCKGECPMPGAVSHSEETRGINKH